MHAHQEQSRFRAVVDTAVDGVILIDAAGLVLMFNPACEQLFGYAAFEVVGRNVKMLMPDPHQAGHDTYLSNYQLTGERKIIGIGREVLGRKRGGQTFSMDLSVGETSEDGKPIFVGIIRDLTERKTAEKALREGGERLRAVVDTAVDGVILIDAVGTVQMFNPACERLFGYAAEEVLGHNVRMLMPLPYRHEHDGYLTNYHRTRTAKVIGIGREVSGLRKDGTTFPMDLSVGEAKQEGASIFVGILHDLTSRKRTEQQLVQAQKMEMVGQLSGGIAHDFNNLLTAILGNAEVLSARLGEQSDLKKLADVIISAADTGAELTQRLLAFSRRQVLQPDVLDCNALVQSMDLLVRGMVREDIELRIGVAAHPVVALADSTQLESAVLNLVLNAQDAMPQGGALSITSSEIELDAESLGTNIDVRAGRYAMIAVTDEGVGMPREVRERAFEPFFTTKEVGKGSGLGLSMVYGFVKQSNGHVTIYSEPSIGTSVRLFLPLSTAGEVQTKTRPASGPVVGGTENVLVVEDDPFVRSHAVTSLEGLGYRVSFAANGREALDLLHHGARPQLLFTDIVMPGGVSGWELAQRAREIAPSLRVLFTSGYPSETLTSRGHIDAKARLLPKPYRVSELARRVREALDAQD
ncbi:PAS domain S-box protein [Terricaulis sp.]|uniref:hybrid sensor histidine kinase/response regulator n=1 Tax=Terricaulis sp. TaxID=2768686 RepID=UPI002AC6EE10|nr:PAS domain S-box protein [Terricaulis sp.]MDZ4689716.1 PAS domain S-box protein [Terricaulis sp.]